MLQPIWIYCLLTEDIQTFEVEFYRNSFFIKINQSGILLHCPLSELSSFLQYHPTPKFYRQNYTLGFVGNCCNHCKLKRLNLKLLLEKDIKSCISSQCWLLVVILTIRTALQLGLITPNNQNLIFDKSSASLNRGHREISIRVGVTPLNVTLWHVVLNIFSVFIHKEFRSLFKELYLIYLYKTSSC